MTSLKRWYSNIYGNVIRQYSSDHTFLTIILFSTQIFYYGKVLEKAQSMDNWQDKISAVLKGPGWFPGTERLGDTMGVPEVSHYIVHKFENKMKILSKRFYE